MDERTKIFVALGAATVANCDPCFEYYFLKAEKLGIDQESIKKTVSIAIKVRGGAQMVMKKGIHRVMMHNSTPTKTDCCCDNSSTCCD